MNMTESTNYPRAWSIILILAGAGMLAVASASFPGCAHLDAGARVGAAMAEHCGDPGMTEMERRECMESYLNAALECAAGHNPDTGDTGDSGDTGTYEGTDGTDG